MVASLLFRIFTQMKVMVMIKEAGKIVVLGVIAFVSVFVYLHALEAVGI